MKKHQFYKLFLKVFVFNKYLQILQLIIYDKILDLFMNKGISLALTCDDSHLKSIFPN